MDIVEEGISVPEDSSPTVSNIVLGERFPVRIDYSNSRISTGSALLAPAPPLSHYPWYNRQDLQKDMQTSWLEMTAKISQERICYRLPLW